MSKIWEKSRSYNLLRYYVDWCTRSSFSSIDVIGKENVPTDGAVLYTPNHCNTLMDALLVLQADSAATGFGARADLFRKETANKALRWLKILPIARERDGRKAIEESQGTYDEVLETIDRGIPFCIYLEGTHRPMHSLMPFKKGVFRLAVNANRKLNKKVYIVPVGLDYYDYNDPMRNAKVTFGKAVNVTEYMEEHPEKSDAEIYHDLSEQVKQILQTLFVFFPDDENYEKAWKEYEEKRRKRFSGFHLTLRILEGFLLLPFMAVFAVFSAPVWITAWILIMRLNDKTWTSSVRYVSKIATLPVITLIIGILSFIFFKWFWAVLILILIWTSPSAFYTLQMYYRDLLDNIKQK